jgi:hypothetical protein
MSNEDSELMIDNEMAQEVIETTPVIEEAPPAPEEPTAKINLRKQREAATEERLNESMPGILEATRRGEPWPANTEKTFEHLRPAIILGVLRDLGVRHKLANSPTQRLGELLRPRRGREPEKSPNIHQLILNLRSQFAVFTSNYAPAVRQKLEHVYQVQLQPWDLRQRMNRFWGFTLVPGKRLNRFPVAKSSEPVYVDLDDVTIQTLSVRPHILKGGDKVDMFDAKLFKMTLDPESGLVYVGGVDSNASGMRFSRCLLARYFNYSPFPGADSRIFSTSQRPLIDAAMATHRVMESATVQGACAQDFPEFPRVYLAFSEEDAVDFEESPGLCYVAYRAVDRWFRQGWPNQWLRFEQFTNTLRNMKRKLRYLGRSWVDVARQLGPDDAKLLLLNVWDCGREEHEGLSLVPLDFFNLYSEQRPVRKAIKAFARLDARVLGREVTSIHEATITDTHGNQLTRPVVQNEMDLGLARPQVIRGGARSMTRTVDGFDYDFTSVPTNLEKFFQVA